MMHYAIIVLALIAHASVAVPRPEPATTQLSVHPVYSPAKENRSPVYYPTYPEYTNKGYSMQSGYEGYLIPSSSPKSSQWSTGSLAASLLPFSSWLILYATRAGSYLLYFTLLMLLGGTFTTIVCMFTPICDITFPGFGINKDQVKEQVAELARTYITPESLNAATLLIARAVDKYAAMQDEIMERQNARKQTPTSDAKVE